MNPKQELIKIKEVKIDPEIYPRQAPFWQKVLEYTDSIKVGDNFPPIAVGKLGRTYFLIDGAHRLEANKKLGETMISAVIYKGISRKDMYGLAVEANTKHGLGLSPMDKARAIAQLEKYGWSREKISEAVRIPVEKLEPFKAKRWSSGTADTEGFVLKAPLKHLAGQVVDPEINDTQKIFASRGQAYLMRQVTKLFITGLVDLDNKEVLEAVKDLKKAISLLNLTS